MIGAHAQTLSIPSSTTSTAMIPGRPSGSVVKSILSNIQRQKQAADANVHRTAAQIDEALKVFEDGYKNEPRSNESQHGVWELRGRLGKGLTPLRAEDVNAIRWVFRNCLETAISTTYKDEKGAFRGPGAKSRKYVNLFLSADAHANYMRVNDDLNNAFVTSTGADKTASAIAVIEGSLDSGNLSYANTQFLALSDNAIILFPEARQYLDGSASLRADLAAYVSAVAKRTNAAGDLVRGLHDLEREVAGADAATPITTEYLRICGIEDRELLRKRLIALPAFEVHLKRTPVDINPEAAYPAAKLELDQLQAALQAASDLVGISSDDSAMQLIRLFFGAELAGSLTAKTSVLSGAREEETKLESTIATLKADLDQEAARQEQERARALLEQMTAQFRKSTWTDQGTGLMWMKRDGPEYLQAQQAVDYCRGLAVAGRTDWRLPTVDELQTIYDPTLFVRGQRGGDSILREDWHVRGNLILSGWEWCNQESGRARSLSGFSFHSGMRGSFGDYDGHALCVRDSDSVGRDSVASEQTGTQASMMSKDSAVPIDDKRDQLTRKRDRLV